MAGAGGAQVGGWPERAGRLDSPIIGLRLLRMKDSQILSAFQELPDGGRGSVPPARPQVLLFDACQVGVVLRAVLFVEAVMAVGAMFGAAWPA